MSASLAAWRQQAALEILRSDRPRDADTGSTNWPATALGAQVRSRSSRLIAAQGTLMERGPGTSGGI